MKIVSNAVIDKCHNNNKNFTYVLFIYPQNPQRDIIMCYLYWPTAERHLDQINNKEADTQRWWIKHTFKVKHSLWTPFANRSIFHLIDVSNTNIDVCLKN